MKKKDQEKDENLLPNWINMKWLNWFVKKRLVICSFFVLFILICIAAYQVVSFFEKKTYKDFIAADLAYSKWNEDIALNGHFDRLTKLMNKHLSLKQKYEGLITQGLILSNHFEEAMQMASIPIKKTKRLLPHYTNFSKNSLIIAQKNYSQALVNAYRLKKEVMLDPSFLQSEDSRTSILFALNLLRICFLEKIMRNEPAEYIAWCEVENYLKLNNSTKTQIKDKELYSFLRLFQSNSQFDLVDYIKHRKLQIH